jgi:uncharacterized membrane protein
MLKFRKIFLFFLIAVTAALPGCGNNTAKDANPGASPAASAKPTPPPSQESSSASRNPDGDLIIPINEITAKANFYAIDIEDTKMEVIAVKAPDGSVRTTFNTCQVCYDSGRGFYKQTGNTLVCQNCGNRFTMDKVEKSSGGCNPVPIFAENKTVDDENITISGEFLLKSREIFENWKTEY